MINQQLIDPKSIVVVGGSNDIRKPGGKALKNLIDNDYKGNLYVINPKELEVQGIKSYQDPSRLPFVDLAILAIAAKYCPATIEFLVQEKNTRAFIILSAGFSEEGPEGAALEEEIVESINNVGGSLLGPNCIGIINQHHASVFTTPIPKLDPDGVDFISGSGATAVFIMEAGMPKGLTFSSVWSVGNSAQIGVEEVLKYLDETFDSNSSSRVKLLYLESIEKPALLLKHASSLIRKGCHIAAIKAGSSLAGSRAASSHTGALASSDLIVDALFKKAGIVRCYGREELITVASVFMHKELKGKNLAIISHAGGPAVMLTDALSNGGFDIPHLESPELLEQLHPGSSVANPIDFLATGTAEQLGTIIDYVEEKFSIIDGMVVIYGSPGLFDVYDVYKTLDQKMSTCKKPIFPVLPSGINAKKEIEFFLSHGRFYFSDEVVLGLSLAKIYHTTAPSPEETAQPDVDKARMRAIADKAPDGYISPAEIQGLLDAAGIPRAGEAIVSNRDDAAAAAGKLGYPVVMKVVGPVHKTDVGGVVLNVKNQEAVLTEFDRMISIRDTTAILIQPMLSGMELFAGVKYEPKFGHMIMCGLGGIFIEILKDFSTSLAPLSITEIELMIRNLKGFDLLKGARGRPGINIDRFADIIFRLSALVETVPEISEMDLNPLLGTSEGVIAVDARICLDHSNKEV